MDYIFIVVYMLIGFQIGGRMFYWDVEVRKQILSFIIPLIIVPLIWPTVLIASLLKGPGVHDALWHWDD